MKIADLFVSLGVKGADTSKNALKGVKSGLGDVKSMGLETKAMIAAVVYGLERMMSQSAKTGTGLNQFNQLTDIGAQNLQKWQFAMQQTGGSADELTSNLKSVQEKMTDMLMGKGAPEGMAMLANKVGFDPKRARDTLYVMGQLQKFAQTVPKDVGNAMIKSFGVSEGTIAAMRQNAFRDDVFKKAPTYNDGEIGQLNKVDVAWGNLGRKFEMAMGHLTARRGLPMVAELSKLADSALKFIGALEKIIEKLHILQGLGKIFEAWGTIFNGISDTADSVSKDKGGVGAGLMKAGKGATEGIGLAAQGAWMTLMENFSAPQVAGQTPGGNKQDITVNQNLNFQHDGKDAKKTSDSVHKATKDAYRQMSTQSQVK